MATVYQTLVLTDVTDDVIRTGLDAEHYSMIWTQVTWAVSVLYGVFAGIWAMARFGGRLTLQVGLVWFALGNLLCGAASDIPTMAAAKTWYTSDAYQAAASHRFTSSIFRVLLVEGPG